MARSKSLSAGDYVEAIPKKTRQGMGKHTKYSASSRNGAKKRYRGQGRKRLNSTMWLENLGTFSIGKTGMIIRTVM